MCLVELSPASGRRLQGRQPEASRARWRFAERPSFASPPLTEVLVRWLVYLTPSGGHEQLSGVTHSGDKGVFGSTACAVGRWGLASIGSPPASIDSLCGRVSTHHERERTQRRIDAAREHWCYSSWRSSCQRWHWELLFLPVTPGSSEWLLLLWSVLIGAVELLPVPVWRGLQVSLGFPLLIMVAILYPPGVAGLIALLGASDPREFRREVGVLESPLQPLPGRTLRLGGGQRLPRHRRVPRTHRICRHRRRGFSSWRPQPRRLPITPSIAPSSPSSCRCVSGPRFGRLLVSFEWES